MKYEVTSIKKTVNGVEVHQIRALKDFGTVKAGDLGRWIEKESNLSQEGTAWISGNAVVYEFSEISDNAKVHGNALIYGYTKVFGNADVGDDAHIINARVFGNAKVYGNVWIFGSIEICDNAQICGDANVSGSARICGDVMIDGNSFVDDDADISEQKHIFVVGPIGNRNNYTTFFKNKDGDISVCCGCF